MKKRTSLFIAILGSILTFGAFAYFASRTGMSLNLFFGVAITPVLLALYVRVSKLMLRLNLSESTSTIVQILFWLIPISWQLISGHTAGTPKAMFERFVSRPMPPSMKNFEWQGGVGIDGFYNFVFEMNAQDTKESIRSLNLELNPDYAALEPLELEKYLADKMSWVKTHRQTFASPIFFHRVAPWRMELVTDTNCHRVYISR